MAYLARGSWLRWAARCCLPTRRQRACHRQETELPREEARGICVFPCENRLSKTQPKVNIAFLPSFAFSQFGVSFPGAALRGIFASRLPRDFARPIPPDGSSGCRSQTLYAYICRRAPVVDITCQRFFAGCSGRRSVRYWAITAPETIIRARSTRSRDTPSGGRPRSQVWPTQEFPVGS